MVECLDRRRILVPRGKYHSITQDTEISTNLAEHESPEPIDDFNKRSELEKGKVYFGTVDRVSGGNAIIQFTPSQHINLGQIDKSVVGEEVRFRYVRKYWGECIEIKYTPDRYDPPNRDSNNSSDRTQDGTITENDAVGNKLLKGKL